MNMPRLTAQLRDSTTLEPVIEVMRADSVHDIVVALAISLPAQENARAATRSYRMKIVESRQLFEMQAGMTRVFLEQQKRFCSFPARLGVASLQRSHIPVMDDQTYRQSDSLERYRRNFFLSSKIGPASLP